MFHLPFDGERGKKMERVMLAKIALSSATFAIDKPYSYQIPPGMSERVVPGVRVLVPFGAGNRRVEGIVLAVEKGQRHDKLKSVLAVLDEGPVLNEELLSLAVWMRERCFCTAYDAARAMLPAGLYFSIRDSYRICEGVDKQAAYEAAGKSEKNRRVLDILYANGGTLEAVRIREAFADQDPAPALKTLVDQKVLELGNEILSRYLKTTGNS